MVQKIEERIGNLRMCHVSILSAHNLINLGIKNNNGNNEFLRATEFLDIAMQKARETSPHETKNTALSKYYALMLIGTLLRKANGDLMNTVKIYVEALVSADRYELNPVCCRNAAREIFNFAVEKIEGLKDQELHGPELDFLNAVKWCMNHFLTYFTSQERQKITDMELSALSRSAEP